MEDMVLVRLRPFFGEALVHLQRGLPRPRCRLEKARSGDSASAIASWPRPMSKSQM